MSKIQNKAAELYPDNLKGNSFNDDHLGGCGTNGDPATHYPMMWKHLTDKLNIKSMVDVGCGFGYTLNFFKNDLGVEAFGVEGSSKVRDLALNKEDIVVHDYCEGPYILKDTTDLIWSCEFVEHVPREFVDNFMQTFKKGKHVAITYATIGQSGHNHVNENTEEYWIGEFSKRGLAFDPHMTFELREKVKEDQENAKSPVDQSPMEKWWYPYHFIKKGLFFTNENV